MSTPSRGLLLVGHGSRDARARAEHDQLEHRVRDAFPTWRVASGFIELSEPALQPALAALVADCAEVVVAPLLLFRGGHIQRDVPAAIAAVQPSAPHTRFVVSGPFGALDSVIALASQRLELHAPSAPARVVLVGRGAKEAEAQQGFQQVLSSLTARHPSMRFQVAYCGVQQPDVASALAAAGEAGPHPVLVVPYLLFAGRLLSEIHDAVAATKQAYPGRTFILCDHLGPDAAAAVIENVGAAIMSKS